MLLKAITIENFKGIGIRQTVNFSPVTLLFGPNSAGKSTVLHALNYLNDIVCHLDPNSSSTRLGEETLDLGGFKQFVHKHDLKRTVKLGVLLDLIETDLYETAANRSYRKQFELSSPSQRQQSGLVDISRITSRIRTASVDLHVAWSEYTQRAYVQTMDLSFDGARFAKIKSSSDGRRTNIEFLNFNHPVLETDDGEEWPTLAASSFNQRYLQGDGHALVGLEGLSQAIPDWRQPLEIADVWSEDEELGNLPLIITALLDCLIRGSLEVLAGELQGLRYLGPLRELPAREYSPEDGDSNWSTGLGAWDRLYKNPSLLREVNKWLGDDHLNTGYQIETLQSLELDMDSPFLGWLNSASLDANREAIQNTLAQMEKRERIVLRDSARNVLVQPNDVGVGISQLLPVVVGALADQVRLFSVEQPEIHIHPRLQVRLGDLLINAAKSKEKLLIVETHSEHLMLRLLRRIREAGDIAHTLPEIHHDSNSIAADSIGAFTPNDLKVLYVECIDGETRIEPIRVSESGRFLDRWPDNFFDERFEEME